MSAKTAVPGRYSAGSVLIPEERRAGGESGSDGDSMSEKIVSGEVDREITLEVSRSPLSLMAILMPSGAEVRIGKLSSQARRARCWWV